MNAEDIANRFAYHPPRSQQRVREHGLVRIHIGEVADLLNVNLPHGREKALAITKLEEAMFWANAALARAVDPNAEVSETEAAAGPRG